MPNIVELATDEGECKDSPCAHGNIVVGHACYCHKQGWPEGPRKCPIWRSFGETDLSKWHRRDWPLVDTVVAIHRNPDGTITERSEPRRYMPDDGKGGCPMFEPPTPQPCNCAANCLKAEGMPVKGYCCALKWLSGQPTGDGQ